MQERKDMEWERKESTESCRWFCGCRRVGGGRRDKAEKGINLALKCAIVMKFMQALCGLVTSNLHLGTSFR